MNDLERPAAVPAGLGAHHDAQREAYDRRRRIHDEARDIQELVYQPTLHA